MDWIDIRKKKPAKGIEVLACDKHGNISIQSTTDYIGTFSGKKSWTAVYQHGNGAKIIAWMPVPEPPRNM